MSKKKRIYFGVGMIFFIFVFFLMIYFYQKNNQVYTIQATVSYVRKDYLLVQDDQGKEYSLSLKSNYFVGDKIIFEVKNMKKTNPIKGNVLSVEKVNQDIGFNIHDEENTSKDNSGVDQYFSDVRVVLDNILFFSKVSFICNLIFLLREIVIIFNL